VPEQRGVGRRELVLSGEAVVVMPEEVEPPVSLEQQEFPAPDSAKLNEGAGNEVPGSPQNGVLFSGHCLNFLLVMDLRGEF